MSKETSKIETFFEEIKRKEMLDSSRSSLHRLLKLMGFKHQKCCNINLIYSAKKIEFHVIKVIWRLKKRVQKLRLNVQNQNFSKKSFNKGLGRSPN